MLFSPARRGEAPHTIVERAQRADPAAEDSAEDKGEGNGNKGQEQGRWYDVGGEKGRHEDQRIKAQEDADRVGDLIRPLVCREEKQDKKERQECPLADAPDPRPDDWRTVLLSGALRNWP